jgi:hypothetical protein
MPNGPLADNGSLATLRRGLRCVRAALGCCRWLSLAAPVLLTVSLAPAQEALRESLAGDAAAQARSLQQESMPYTFKSGDFKLLVTPSLNLSWNDNINLARTNVLQDCIFLPALGLSMTWIERFWRDCHGESSRNRPVNTRESAL